MACVLFGLPEYDQTFTRLTQELVDALAIARSPLLSQMGPPVRTSSTVGSRVRARDGVDVDLPGTEMRFQITTEAKAVLAADVEAYAQQIDAAAEQIERAMVKHLFSTMQDLTAATGNVVDAAGRPAFEALYEMLDKIEWSLTEDGGLSMPTIVGGRDTVAILESLTDEQNAAIQALQRRKHEELIARRRRRRLS
jgi:hypothetical protein